MDVNINGQIVELERQRNQALTDSATRSGQLAVAYQTIASLEEKVKELQAIIDAQNLPEPDNGTDTSTDDGS